MAINLKGKIDLLKDLVAKKSPHTLSLKLISAIGALVLIGSAISWYVIIIRGEKEFLKNSIRHTQSYAEMIEKGIFANMHVLQIEEIQQTLETLTKKETLETLTKNIKDIKIYNFKGDIHFASDKENIGQKIDVNSPSCRLCHNDPHRPLETLKLQDPQKTMWTIYKDRNNQRTLKLVRYIVNQKTCYTATCHTHPSDRKVLGILETDYSLSDIDNALKSQKLKALSFGIIFTIFLCMALFIILWKILIKPLYLLADGIEHVSHGDLDYRIEMDTKDEMGTIANIFNSMTQELKSDRQKLENWTKELEAEVARKTEEIRRRQERFMHTEKLASLGRMVAGVAHEINNPLTGIVTSAHLIIKRIPPENKMDREDLEVIIEHAERCSKIIKELRGFSRAIPAEMTDIDINNTIRHTLEIIHNQAKFHNIKIATNLSPDLPHIQGDALQLEQVYMNLLINAADAMNDRGQITIATKRIREDERDYIEVEFTDTGPGIPEEHLGSLFEPFFTTKPVGKGTGFGLPVSHGIVRKHGGSIRVKSTPDKGTSFYIRLPISGSEITEDKGAEE